MKKALSVIAETDEIRGDAAGFAGSLKEETEGIGCELIIAGQLPEETIKAVEALGSDDFSVRALAPGRGESMPALLNRVLGSVTGEVLHICSDACEYEKGAVKAALDLLKRKEDAGIVALTPYTFGVNNDVRGIRHFYIFGEKYPVSIDLAETPERWCRSLFPLFIKREAAEGLRFCETLTYEYRRAFLSSLFAACPAYIQMSEKAYTHGYTDADLYNYHPVYDKAWYLEELPLFAEAAVLPEDSLRTGQRILMDFISVQFMTNADDRNKSILLGDDFTAYMDILRDVLGKVDDDVITEIHTDLKKRLPFAMYTVFLCLKHGVESVEMHPEVKDEKYKYRDGYVGKRYGFLTESGDLITTTDVMTVNIKAINRIGNRLAVDAELLSSLAAGEDALDISAEGSAGYSCPAKRNRIYSLFKYFGVSMYRCTTFSFELPAECREEARYHISIKYKGMDFAPDLKFVRPQSRLYEVMEHNSWVTGKTLVHYDVKQRELVLSRAGALKRISAETGRWSDIMKLSKNKKRGLSFVGLRFLYYVVKPVYGRRNIWMTFDQLFKGGDNGEYFYRYVSERRDPGQTIYYVVNKDTHEYRDLSSKYKTVLAFSSLKHKLISLHTNIMFATRASAELYAGFSVTAEVYFRDLFNFETVCLQHGLTIQQIAQYQNRLFDNLKYYFCVSKYEIANLSKPIYGYDDKSVLALTGAPRYDGLTGDPLRQIVISPTWRRNVTSGNNRKGHQHKYSDNFKDTEYFRIYNGLINDERLLSCARETGYELIYLVHPIMSPQINDFDKNDVVKMVPGAEANYEKMLTEAALLVTDHSGIMYDFAYQRKPLIYYHPEELPPQYSEGGLKYETMGFGPVCKTRDALVDELCEYMKSGCSLKPMYRERIEDFFEFDDQKNCERVYLAAKDFEKRFRGGK